MTRNNKGYKTLGDLGLAIRKYIMRGCNDDAPLNYEIGADGEIRIGFYDSESQQDVILIDTAKERIFDMR